VCSRAKGESAASSSAPVNRIYVEGSLVGFEVEPSSQVDLPPDLFFFFQANLGDEPVLALRRPTSWSALLPAGPGPPFENLKRRLSAAFSASCALIADSILMRLSVISRPTPSLAAHRAKFRAPNWSNIAELSPSRARCGATAAVGLLPWPAMMRNSRGLAAPAVGCPITPTDAARRAKAEA